MIAHVMAHLIKLIPIVMLIVGCGVAPTAAPRGPALHNDRPTAVPLHFGGDYAMVRAAVDGHDAGLFLLDTGSNLTGVERGTGNRLGLHVIGEGEAHGIAGSETFDYRRFDSVSLAGFRLRPRALAGLNLARIHGGSARWAGLLGFDALAHETWTLDQQAGTLTLGDTFPPTPAGQRLINWNGLPVVEAKLAGRAVWLLLDTGADRELSLHDDVVRRWPDILAVPESGPGRSRGVGGSVAGRLSWVRSVELLGVTLHDVAVSVDPRPAGLSDPRIAGRVGNQLLRHYRLTFDLPHGRIAAAWRPITADPGR